MPPTRWLFCPEFRAIRRDRLSRYGNSGIRLGWRQLGVRCGFSVFSQSGHAR